ncbi:MAG: CDP-glucose 4,6-dehydratase [Pseudomonadota bacterium]
MWPPADGTVMEQAFWRGRRVLVTGHTGFKGSWLATWLDALGATVTGIGLDPPTTPSHFDLAGVGTALFADHRIDVRDGAAVERIITAAEPQVVFHLAAQPLVLKSYAAPVDTFHTNIMGTAHVVRAAATTASVEAIVVVTSDKVYDNREWPHPYREPDKLGGHHPYSASKACAELVTASLRQSLATQAAIATARAGNVIGGGDFAANRIVPDCARAFCAAEPVVLRRPDAVRPFQHVLDALSGYLLLAQWLVEGDGGTEPCFNFGPDPGGEQTVGALAGRMAEMWGADASVIFDASPDAHPEAGLLRLDSTKARVTLGWHPAWDFETVLAQTTAWYRAWNDGADLAALTRRQIADYEAVRPGGLRVALR